MPYWDERVEAMSKKYPDVRVDKFHVRITSTLLGYRSDLIAHLSLTPAD